MVGQGQLFVLVVILIVGIVFGAGVAWWILGSRKSKAPATKPASPPDELAGLRARYAEQAGLWQEKKSRKLVLRLENQMLENAGQLNGDQRARLEALTKELLAWLGIAQPAAPAAAAVSAPVKIFPAAPQVPTPAAEVRPSQPLPSPVVVAPVNPVPAKPQSIVEQIDEILQDKLAHSTSSNKAVRLVEDPQHGVVVWVGLDHYAGVDGVTDPEVRALLREAAEEWERRATPNKK